MKFLYFPLVSNKTKKNRQSHTDDHGTFVQTTQALVPYFWMAPPSPNWFCAHGCDFSPSTDDSSAGLAAIASKNVVLLLLVQPTKSRQHATFIGQLAHNSNSRVSAVALGKSLSSLNLCVSGCDNRVRLWNINECVCIQEHTTHSEEVTALTILGDSVVSADSGGTIVVWHIASSSIRKIQPNPNRDAITCMDAVNKHLKDDIQMTESEYSSLIVVGFVSGCLYAVDVHRGNVIHQFRGHTGEIQSVKLQLVCTDTPRFGVSGSSDKQSNEDLEISIKMLESIEETENTMVHHHIILASCDKDRNVCIWDIRDGNQLWYVKISIILFFFFIKKFLFNYISPQC